MPDEPLSLDVIGEKLRLLAEAVKEVDDALLTRHGLEKKFLDEIDQEIAQVRYHIGFLGEPWHAGFLPALESLRVAHHKALTSRRMNRRKEEIEAWRDRERLLQLRRELVMEYRALAAAKRQAQREG